MKEHKFVGTIIDKSYYDLYDGIFKDQAAKFRMCAVCDTPIVMVIGSGNERQLARGRYHECETYKYLGIRWDDWHEFRFVSDPSYGDSPLVAMGKLRT